MEMENPSILDASEPVSRAINEISRTGLPVVVTKDRKYMGIIDERVLRTHANPSKEKCGTLAERAPTLKPDAAIMDACRAFFSGRYKAIPIIDGSRIIGAYTRHTILAELLSEKMLTKKSVSEAMTSPVSTIELTASVGQARGELRKHNIRRLVVTQKGKIAGLFSVFDLASYASNPRESSAFYRGGEKVSLDEQPLISYMKKDVETIAPTDSLANAVRRMLDGKVSALIVQDGGYPQGIVTAKDILHAALQEEKRTRVFVSGLPYEQREYQAEIVSEGEKLLAKVGKSSEVHSLVLHIKPEGSGFAIRARLDGKTSFNASASDYRLEAAVSHTLDELSRMALNRKEISTSEKHHRKGNKPPEE